MAGIEAKRVEPSWWDVMWSMGRWALVPAACAPVALGAILLAAGGWFDEAIFVASSVGWIP